MGSVSDARTHAGGSRDRSRCASLPAGCGSSNSGSSSSTSSSGGETLTVGSDIPYPPFEQGKPGHYTGFDVELMEAIGEEDRPRRRIPGHLLRNDLPRSSPRASSKRSLSAATITPEREKTVDFSNPYYLSEQAILVKEGSDNQVGRRPKGCHGRPSSRARPARNSSRKKPNAGELRPYPEGPDAVNALKAGTVEAVMIDAPVAQNAVEEAQAASKFAEKVPTEEEYGIAVAQGETELLEEINKGLERSRWNDGTYAKIYKKWFHREPPKAIFTATHEGGMTPAS